MSTIPDLLNAPLLPGRIEWIGISSERRATILSVDQIELIVGKGIVGEHHSKKRAGGKRQVTLIQAEHLPVVASLLRRECVDPASLRRNIVVAGLNLLALKRRQFRLGTAILEGTGPCEPCSRMEENLGPGGYNAMRGHGGLTAKVLEPGIASVGDEVCVI